MAAITATLTSSLSSKPKTSFLDTQSSSFHGVRPIKASAAPHNNISMSASPPPYDLKSFKFDPIKESIVSREMTRRYMMDMITYADTDVVVVGAGSAGLSCAYELSKNPSVQFTLHPAMASPPAASAGAKAALPSSDTHVGSTPKGIAASLCLHHGGTTAPCSAIVASRSYQGGLVDFGAGSGGGGSGCGGGGGGWGGCGGG